MTLRRIHGGGSPSGRLLGLGGVNLPVWRKCA